MVQSEDNGISIGPPGLNSDLPCKDVAKEFYAHYQPKDVIGHGGSCVVRRCIHKETGIEYAVKIVDVSDTELGFDLREEVTREVEILRILQGHPNIIELESVYFSDTFMFLVFELCPNGELFDYLTTTVALGEKKARQIMKQICEAVQHCHRHGILHRDLKPENILLDKQFNVKLTDFGFARKITPGERFTDLCGTPGYMAPEMLESAMYGDERPVTYGLAIDAWALGVIFHTVLVGFPPFWHRKQMTLIRNIMNCRYSFNSPEWQGITEEAKDLIDKLLQVDETKRFTVEQALKHPVFSGVDRKESKFNARETFKRYILCVRFLIRFARLKDTPEPLSLALAARNPYAMRMFRKVIDKNCFNIYNHWVKRGEGQNRAALFEHYPRREILNAMQNTRED